MRTLHVGLRVSNLDPSLAFYRAVGYTVTGTVEGTPSGNLTMLQLPGDPFVTIELVRHPAKGKAEPGTGINHLVQAESLDAALADLAVKGIAADSPADPDHADRPRTNWIAARPLYLAWSRHTGPCRRTKAIARRSRTATSNLRANRRSIYRWQGQS